MELILAYHSTLLLFRANLKSNHDSQSHGAELFPGNINRLITSQVNLLFDIVLHLNWSSVRPILFSKLSWRVKGWLLDHYYYHYSVFTRRTHFVNVSFSVPRRMPLILPLCNCLISPSPSWPSPN